MRFRVCATIIIFTSIYLISARLDTVAFWEDEAHVAFIGRQLAHSGHVTLWDGRNLLPDKRTRGGNERPLQVMEQLDVFLVAVSFRAFGESNWSARLPFALCGIGALLVWWGVMVEEFHGEPLLQLYALAGNALSVNFILYCRNCRYYAASILCTGILFYAYRRYLDTRRFIHVSVGSLAASFLALSSVLNCATVLAAIFARHICFHRHECSRRDWLMLSSGAMIFRPFSHSTSAPSLRPL